MHSEVNITREKCIVLASTILADWQHTNTHKNISCQKLCLTAAVSASIRLSADNQLDLLLPTGCGHE